MELNNKQIGKITLPQMEFMACHGVFPEEKQTPQLFRIGVEMVLDLTAAGASDDLTQTVNYGEVYLRIKQLVEGNTFNLIETLATKIAEEILKNKGIELVTARVEKAGAQVTPEIAIPACVEITKMR